VHDSNWSRDLAGAWIFYTVLPGLPWLKPRFERIARFAPLIGILIGLLQAGVWLLLARMGWSKEPLALLTIGIGLWMTGGLHLDGLMDTADGLAAGKDRCLEAMRDSRVGSSGVQALTLVLLIQLAALIKLDTLTPFAIPIATFWGRCSPLWAIERFSYLHQNESASFHQVHWKKWKEFMPLLLVLTIAFLTLQVTPINLISRVPLMTGISIGVLPTIIVPELIGRKLGGHSGDSYGASLVFVETFMLLLLAMIL